MRYNKLILRDEEREDGMTESADGNCMRQIVPCLRPSRGIRIHAAAAFARMAVQRLMEMRRAIRTGSAPDERQACRRRHYESRSNAAHP
ncbi:MAG: hypothetical protein ACLUHE_17115 [Christensenellales bacterium]